MVVCASVSADEQNQPEIQPEPDQGCFWYQHAMAALLGANRCVSCSENNFCFCFPIHSIELVKISQKLYIIIVLI